MYKAAIRLTSKDGIDIKSLPRERLLILGSIYHSCAATSCASIRKPYQNSRTLIVLAEPLVQPCTKQTQDCFFPS